MLLAISRCFLTEGRLVIDSEYHGLLTDDQLLSPLIIPTRSHYPNSKRTMEAPGTDNYREDIGHSIISEDEEENAENTYDQVQRRSPT